VVVEVEVADGEVEDEIVVEEVEVVDTADDTACEERVDSSELDGSGTGDETP
jgi:hypothetical protein